MKPFHSLQEENTHTDPAKKRHGLEDRLLHFPIKIEGETINEDLIVKAFKSAIEALAKEIEEKAPNKENAGSTFAATLALPSVTIAASTGDSSVFQIGKNEQGQWMSTRLNRHHNPLNDDELERLRKDYPFKYVITDNKYIKKVDDPENKKKRLAMTRAFGNIYFKDCGVISKADHYKSAALKKDAFLLLATDAIDIFSKPKLQEIIQALANEHLQTLDDQSFETFLSQLNDRIKTEWNRLSTRVDDATYVICTQPPGIAVVCDGHGGSEVAQYIVDHFKRIFDAELQTRLENAKSSAVTADTSFFRKMPLPDPSAQKPGPCCTIL